MSSEQKNSQHDWHRKFAIESFNGTWELLEKTDRTPEETQRMFHMAHASRYHWGEIGTPLNFARGDWLISRVYATQGFGVMSFRYAISSLELCEKNDIGDFDLAFAYEALARACAVSGDVAKASGYITLAKTAGEEIAKEEDRQYFYQELYTVPGYEHSQ
jgi:hypothetical protein